MRDTVALVITAHGYGHASRQMEVLRVLLGRRPALRAAVFSVVPEAVFRDYLDADPALSARISVIPFRADVGVVQKDGLVMDHAATIRALDERSGDPDRAAADLAAAIAPVRPAAILADIPPIAFAAARRLGVPSAAAGNFDWSFIYAHYAAETEAFARYRDLAAGSHALADVAVHLPPGPPLTGFPRVIAGAPLARRLLVDPAAVRAGLGVPEGHRAVLVSFGGFGLEDAHRRIPEVPGVTWILAPPMVDLGRADTRFAPRAPYLALLAACDAVFTKPGYGIVCEAARNRTRLLYTDRGDFPEYPWLVRWLHDNAPAVHVPSAALGTADGARAVREAIEALFALPDRWVSIDAFSGADQVADAVEALL